MRVVYTTAVSFSVRCLFYPGFIGFTRVGTDCCRSDFAFAYEVHFMMVSHSDDHSLGVVF